MSEFTREQLMEYEKQLTEATSLVVPTKDFMDPDELYKKLIERILKYHPNDDVSMIEKAYKIAKEAHKEQKRKSGEPYIIHPLSVALILADLELDKETIVAGILHDVVEDTAMTYDDVSREFSPEIALLVDGVTKLTALSYNSDKVDVQAENLRKMFLAMAKDIRVLLIKLADRLHNMRTMQFQSPEKQKEKSRETMEIYSPLAQRLGISRIKIELDDLSLKYLEPDSYYDLIEKIALRHEKRETYVDELVNEVGGYIKSAGIKAEVYGRAKHFFSIYRKMVNQNKTLDQIYDLFAVRIIVDDLKDCYAALGVIHENYTPIPGRFKDYIAMPKANMYQSLHTTVIGPGGTPFEIQIRTWDMHRTSEYGIAAHWKYKESGEGSKVAGEEEKLAWLRQILEWQQDMSDNKEFVSLLKSDFNLFGDTVFCFTPSGDVKNLPVGSTPIDFAYSIHSAVGNKMVGAKVNGKLVPIEYVIQNGDRIEIITSQNAKGPSRDWLNIVKSSQAKNKINQWFRNVAKDDNVVKGRELVQAYAKAKAVDLGLIGKPEYLERVQHKFGYHSWEDTLAAVGQGALKEGSVVSRMVHEYEKDHPVKLTDEAVMAQLSASGVAVDGVGGTAAGPQMQGNNVSHHHSKSGIMVNGLYDVSVRFSKCCNPVPGDEIIGYVTRGRGVTIHRTDCINMINLPEFEKDRLLEAEWQDEELAEGELYQTELKIYCNNRRGLLVDLTRAFTERNIDIDSINSNTSKQGVVTISIKFGTKSREELSSMIEKLNQIEGIVDILRTSS